MFSTSSGSFAFVSIVLLGVGAASAQSPPSYSLTPLGSASGVSEMNEFGVVIGQAAVGNATRAFVASTTAPYTLLPLAPGDQSSWALDINEQGEIVGALSTSISPEFGGRAVRWTPNGAGGYTRTELGALPGYTGSVATAINNLGDIVGYSRSGMFRYAVLFTAPGGVLDLNPLGVFDPQAINDSRQMLDKQCKRLDLDTMVVETGYSINELGQIAGTAVLATSTSCVYQAARHMDDYGWQMLSTCSPLANAYDINDIGDVLFQAIGITNIVHLEGIGDYTGQLLLGPNAGPYTVHSVGAINDSRQLAVIATNTATGVTGVAIMSPLGVCQADLGFDGPGASQLSVCGGNLAVGTTANLTLYGAGENSTAFLIAGVSAAPMNWLGGTLVPVPLIVVAIPTGPTGTTLVPIAGGLGAVSIYLQAAHVDAAQPMGVGISNAVRIDFLP
jgi:uncharacterized membrane protein